MRSSLLHFTAALLIVLGLGSNSAAGTGSASNANQVADDDAIVWGGDHIQLKLTKAGGTVEFDCAIGTPYKTPYGERKG
jgi:hypothetical protein